MRLKARYGITRSTGIFITIFLRIDVANGELLYNSGYSGSGGSQLPTYYRYRIIKPVISKIASLTLMPVVSFRKRLPSRNSQ